MGSGALEQSLTYHYSLSRPFAAASLEEYRSRFLGNDARSRWPQSPITVGKVADMRQEGEGLLARARAAAIKQELTRRVWAKGGGC